MLNSICLRVRDYRTLPRVLLALIFLLLLDVVAKIGERTRYLPFLQPSLQQEVILARMEQILASRSLTDDEYAQLLYERGVLYDSLSLRALARNDFQLR